MSRFLAGEYVRKAQGEAAYWWRFHRMHENVVHLETRATLACGPYTLVASVGRRGMVRVDVIAFAARAYIIDVFTATTCHPE